MRALLARLSPVQQYSIISLRVNETRVVYAKAFLRSASTISVYSRDSALEIERLTDLRAPIECRSHYLGHGLALTWPVTISR